MKRNKTTTGCGLTGPEGYRCTHHENGEHVARGTEPGSFAEAWPIRGFQSRISEAEKELAARKRGWTTGPVPHGNRGVSVGDLARDAKDPHDLYS